MKPYSKCTQNGCAPSISWHRNAESTLQVIYYKLELVLFFYTLKCVASELENLLTESRKKKIKKLY